MPRKLSNRQCIRCADEVNKIVISAIEYYIKNVKTDHNIAMVQSNITQAPNNIASVMRCEVEDSFCQDGFIEDILEAINSNPPK